MEKKIIKVLLVFGYSMVQSQIGLNTPSPQATLDVVGNPGSPSILDGIIPPRLTGNQLRAKSYTSSQTGAIVYVTTADYTPSGQTINVVSAGYYYFNGTVWVTLGVSNNIPNGTGTIIAVNGQSQIAQEISVRLDGDFKVPINAVTSIGRMTQELIDNYNSFSGTSTSNSFTVQTDGTYLVTMNFSLQPQDTTPLNGNCFFGIRDLTDNEWVAFNIETIVSLPQGYVKNISYQVAIDLLASKTYSFAIKQEHNLGSPIVFMRGVGLVASSVFPMAFFSVKKLK